MKCIACRQPFVTSGDQQMCAYCVGSRMRHAFVESARWPGYCRDCLHFRDAAGFHIPSSVCSNQHITKENDRG